MHMALDEVLLDRVIARARKPAVRFWSWVEPALVIGSHQSVVNEVDLVAARRLGFTVTRRMSGGGTMICEPGRTITYSMYLPDSAVKELSFRQSYAALDSWAVRSFVSLGVPMLLTGSGRSVRPMYLEGMGPLFMIKVNFPLMPPAKAEEKTASQYTKPLRQIAALVLLVVAGVTLLNGLVALLLRVVDILLIGLRALQRMIDDAEQVVGRVLRAGVRFGGAAARSGPAARVHDGRVAALKGHVRGQTPVMSRSDADRVPDRLQLEER